MKRAGRYLLRAAELLLMLIFLLAAIFHQLVSYGIDQGAGQLRVVMNARPIEEVMEDSAVSDSIKIKLRLVGEIKQFAIDSLGLKESKNYTELYDQHGKPVLWVLTGAEKYKMKAFEWHFPVVGRVGYKGFFKFEKGKKEEDKLIKEGYDTDYSPTSAWSTLGWFKDPILSNVLRRKPGQLAELFIHEMTHATLYVKSSVDFNENLANAIGETGAEKFLKSKYGTESDELKAYIEEREDYNLYAEHLLRGTRELDSLYKAMESKSIPEKEILKKEMILKIISSLDTVPFHNARFKSRFDKDNLPNNSYFLSFVRYDSQKEEQKKELVEKFGGNIGAYLRKLKENEKEGE